MSHRPSAQAPSPDRGASALGDALPDSVHGNTSLFRVLHRQLRGRYRWAALLGLVGAAACGYAGWKAQAPQYLGQGLIYIEPSMPSLQDPLGQSVLPMFQGFVSFQVRMMESPRATQLAMESEAWQQTGRGREPEVVKRFTERRAVLLNPGGQDIQVQFFDEQPEVALAGVRALIDAYQKMSIGQNANDELMQNAKAQTEALSASLRDGADRLVRLSAEFGGEETLQARHVATMNQLLAAEEDLAKIRRTIASYNQTESGSREPSPKTEAEIALENDSLAKARLDLGLLEIEEAQLRETTGEKNPALVTLRNQLKARRKWIDGFVEDFNRWHHNEWDRRRKGTNANLTTLEDLRAEEAARLKDIEVLQIANQKFAKIRVEIGALRGALEDDGRKLEQWKKAKDQLSGQLVGTGRIKIQDRGTLPTMAFRDRRTAFAAAGGMLGGVLGVAIVLLFGLRNRKFRYTDDVGTSLASLRLLGLLPTLPEDLADPQQGEIAAHCVHQVRTLLQIGHSRDEGGCICITGPGVGSGKTTLSLALGLSFGRSGSRTLLIDADLTGRGLTRRVGQMLLSHVKRVAGEPGDPSVRSARGAGGAGSPSVLLEPLVTRRGVGRRPGTEELLELLSRSTDRYGFEDVQEMGQVARLFALADLLFPPEARVELAARLQSLSPSTAPRSGKPDAPMIPPPVQELKPAHPEFNGTALDRYVYPTGADLVQFLPLRGLGAGGGVSVATLSKILARVRNEFDVVLVDTGPVLGSLETQVVAAHTDAVVFVVSPGDHRPDAERSVAKLEEVGARIAGVVFNRAHPEDVYRASGSYSSLTSRGDTE